MPRAELPFVPPDPPPVGGSLPLGNGLHWARVPMPLLPGHTNVLLVEHPEGWTLVDAGWNDTDGRKAWRQILAAHGNPPIRQVIASHGHADHVSLAGWLCRETGAPLKMNRQEWYWAREVQLASDYPAHEAIGAIMGLPAEVLVHLKAWRHEFFQLFKDLPGHFEALEDGGRLDCGTLEFDLICGGGHALGMMGFASPGANVLIAADHLLPNVVAAQIVPIHEPQADSIAAQFRLLDRLQQLPRTMLVVPSHGQVFAGLHPRIAEVRAHHQSRLDRLADALATNDALTVWQAVPHYFGRKMRVERAYMASAEVMSHLNHLVATGRAGRRQGDSGLFHYYAA